MLVHCFSTLKWTHRASFRFIFLLPSALFHPKRKALATNPFALHTCYFPLEQTETTLRLREPPTERNSVGVVHYDKFYCNNIRLDFVWKFSLCAVLASTVKLSRLA